MLMCNSEQSLQPGRAPGACILVLDDDDDIRCLFKLGLEAAGFTVLLAATQLELQHRLAHARPNALILDLQRSHTEGLQVLARMRTRKQLDDVPILFLAGSDEPDLRSKALFAGADWFALRPVSIVELKNQLRNVVRDGRPSVTTLRAARSTIVAR